MQFPDSPRVIYKNNPLTEVIGQVRFAPILRIEAEPPADFQEGLRSDYPGFQESRPEVVPGDVPPEIASIMKGLLPKHAGVSSYEFASEDGHWTITLSRESLTLRTLAYQRWENFRSRLTQALGQLLKVYAPIAYTRLGLRYVDVVRRSILDLNTRPWGDLLQPHIAGVFSATGFNSNRSDECIEHARTELRLRLGGSRAVTIRHGTAVANGERPQEICYYIDSDFSTEAKTEPNNAIRIFDEFNGESRCLFRWCISDELHDAMGPESVD